MRYLSTFTIAALGLAAVALTTPTPAPAQPAAVDDGVQAGVEVQARGAVHEAYGEPTQAAPTPGVLVPKAPPARIEEVPPEEKPAGDNVVWIPGYWAYDPDATDFTWISGFWRVAPPGRVWTPGVWQVSAEGNRWVSGYWGVPEQQAEVEYLPAPPAPVDAGPSIPAPSPESVYVPGVHVYQTSRYVWRPGYWIAHRPGWVWVSACYRWTPCGYVYIPGYWDMPLLERGLLYAPVRFEARILRPGFVYRPAFVVQPDFLCGALFVRAGRPCYFFGDYFAPAYRTDFVAWNSFRFGRGRFGVDLNFTYYRNAYRGNPAWETGLTGLYAGRFAGTIARPPVTLRQQTTVINNITVNKTVNNVVNKNVNITNIQNVSALAPARGMRTVQTNGLSSLAGVRAGAALPVSSRMTVERASKATLDAEKAQIARYQAIRQDRRDTAAGLLARSAAAPTAPVKVKVELPKTVAAPRIAKAPTGPTAPPAPPKTEIRPTVNVKPTVITRPKVDVKPSDPKPPVRPVDPKPPVNPKPVDPKPPVKPIDPKPPVKPVDPKPPVRPMPPVNPKPVDPKPPVRPVDPKPPVTPPVRPMPPVNPKPADPKPPVTPPVRPMPPVTPPVRPMPPANPMPKPPETKPTPPPTTPPIRPMPKPPTDPKKP